MTMTDPTTKPEVPAWLDLDAIIPAELRARIAAATAEGEQLLTAVRSWAQSAWAIVQDHDDAMTAAGTDAKGADLYDLIGPLTGYNDLWNVAASIRDNANAIADPEDVADGPDWINGAIAARKAGQ